MTQTIDSLQADISIKDQHLKQSESIIERLKAENEQLHDALENQTKARIEQRKAWSVDRAIEMLKARDLPFGVDDVKDTATQLSAYVESANEPA